MIVNVRIAPADCILEFDGAIDNFVVLDILGGGGKNYCSFVLIILGAVLEV